MIRTIEFLARHPMTRSRFPEAVLRFGVWQVGSRLASRHLHRWVDGSVLVVERGMTGATGNIYCGLHEFADMGFLLHLLRPGDIFLDVGANIGSYTVLASAVCGAMTIAFEPDPTTMAHLKRNVAANRIERLVKAHELALGRTAGAVAFTIGRDTVNHVATSDAKATRQVQLSPLDAIAGAQTATFLKLDVEGYEAEVLAGAAKVLLSSDLLAIETEADDEAVVSTLLAHGFVRRWYNPFTRTLAARPFADLTASNALYVRDEARVLHRVAEAPRRRILHHWI